MVSAGGQRPVEGAGAAHHQRPLVVQGGVYRAAGHRQRTCVGQCSRARKRAARKIQYTIAADRARTVEREGPPTGGKGLRSGCPAQREAGNGGGHIQRDGVGPVNVNKHVIGRGWHRTAGPLGRIAPVATNCAGPGNHRYNRQGNITRTISNRPIESDADRGQIKGAESATARSVFDNLEAIAEAGAKTADEG